MFDIDMDAVAELVTMALTPVCGTLSVLLGKSVHISSPRLERLGKDEVAEIYPSPFVVIGSTLNSDTVKSRQLFLLKKETVQSVANIIMGVEQDEFYGTIDEITLSTIREVANQCLRTSDEAFTEFLGKPIKQELMGLTVVSDPGELRKRIDSLETDRCLGMRCRLKIDGIIDTDFYGVIPDKMLEALGFSGSDKVTGNSIAQGKGLKTIAVKNIRFPEFKVVEEDYSVQDIDENRKKIMDISLDVSVQIGSAVCTVRDILGLEEGQIIVLDKQAGSPADVVVNGEYIGKGDMIMLEDQFAARITEIVDKRDAK